MYAVIFKAEIAQLDQGYHQSAKRMRELAMGQYGCVNFFSACENNVEIAISYWPSLKHIQAWKHNAEHQEAQKRGKTQWYKSYSVEIVEVIREYTSSEPRDAVSFASAKPPVVPAAAPQAQPKPERMGAGDVDALMQRLALEEARKQKPLPSKRSVYKLIGIVAIVIILALLLF